MIGNKKFFVLLILGIVTFAGAAQMVKQDLDYTDQGQSFYNPDRGFYTPQVIHFYTTGNDTKPYSNSFIHLRADISEFSDNSRWGSDESNPEHGTSQDLTEEMLSSFKNYLELLRSQNATVVVRFCYDPWYNGSWSLEPGKFEMEPGQEWILKHVAQLAEVYNEYEDVITAVELGMYGPYGENHTSSLSGSVNAGEAFQALISSTNNTDVLGRTPGVIANGFSFTTETFDVNHESFKTKVDSIGENFYRAGLFNDGYLGTEYDYGTWGTNCSSSICREEGMEWLETYGAHVPYGGEALATASGYKKINTAEFMAYEGFRSHTSYLNSQWNDALIAEWKASSFTARDTIDWMYDSDYDSSNTAYKYIDTHLGYRYVLRESNLMDSIGVDGLLELDLKIQNVGFGNMTKNRKVTLILRAINETSGEALLGNPMELNLSEEFDPQNILCRTVELESSFDGNGNIADYDNIETKTTFDGINSVQIKAQLPSDLEEGEYGVFLRISQYGNWPSDSNYSTIRFANDSSYFDTLTGSNYVGKFAFSSLVESIKPEIANGVNDFILEGGVLKFRNVTKVKVFDVKGQICLSESGKEISLNNLPKGLFVIKYAENKTTKIKAVLHQ